MYVCMYVTEKMAYRCEFFGTVQWNKIITMQIILSYKIDSVIEI